jgi:hypothetical protein
MVATDHTIFKIRRIAEDDWQIEAHSPGAEVRYITGFKSEGSAMTWIEDGRSREWAKAQGDPK